MKRTFQIFTGLMALAFAKVGLEALISPAAVLANVGITLETAAANSSMRAVYGGMHLIFGLYCAWGVLKTDKGPLVLLFLYTLGFLLGRTASLWLDGAPNDFVQTWFITEAVCLGVSLFLLRNWHRIESTQPVSAIA